MTKKIVTHWADQTAQRIIAQKGNKKQYVCAAGITPSGTIHIGNFREIITVALVARALQDTGKKVRFIYSWDDYDVFRKVPINMPKQVMLKKELRKAIVDVPDPFETEDSYARHHEVEVEQTVAKVGIAPEYLYQSKKYRKCEYVEGIKKALQHTKEIKAILDKYRKEPLSCDWLPISGYCPVCGLDNVTFSDYDGKYCLKMMCASCHKTIDVHLKKAPFVKLPWRVDWPMRWAYEKVDFEPGGKDHSTPGGSYSTGKEIVELYKWTAPTYIMYDFVRIKGAGGKISSSKGHVITLGDCLDIYEPAIVRWLFAGTRPNTEFAISFDLDVIKIYEDFDRCERIYYDQETVSEKKKANQKRIYELSCIDKIPQEIPYQPSFRHLTNVLLIHGLDIEKAVGYYEKQLKNKTDKERLHHRANCAKNWINQYAPDDFKYAIATKLPAGLKLSNEMKKAFRTLAKRLQEKEWTDKELHEEFYIIIKNLELEIKDFFKASYTVLINKNKGPKLANFILTIGRKKVAKLFEKI